mmetsp:Transcript_4264/g.7138  ORF Transcript_4264/g.7138 Transcript_4264/m.7138 type:complete len:161 (-) Transcript_4264:138-620(-)
MRLFSPGSEEEKRAKRLLLMEACEADIGHAPSGQEFKAWREQRRTSRASSSAVQETDRSTAGSIESSPHTALPIAASLDVSVLLLNLSSNFSRKDFTGDEGKRLPIPAPKDKARALPVELEMAGRDCDDSTVEWTLNRFCAHLAKRMPVVAHARNSVILH